MERNNVIVLGESQVARVRAEHWVISSPSVQQGAVKSVKTQFNIVVSPISLFKTNAGFALEVASVRS